MRAGQNGGQRNCQGRGMSQRVEVRRACAAAHPQPFLTCGFEAGIVALTLCTQGVCSLETEAAAVNGKSVVIGNGPVFRAAPAFLPIVPVFVAAGANTSLRLAERTAVFLPGTPIVGRLAVLVHGKPSLADRITGRKSFQGFRAAWIEGDKRLALIDRFTVAQALEPRVANCSLSLTFDGTTAICEAICTGNSSTDQVKATIELYQGNTYLASWSNEETYFVAISGQRGVTRGKSYTLKLTYTINGVAQPEQSVTKVCR